MPNTPSHPIDGETAVANGRPPDTPENVVARSSSEGHEETAESFSRPKDDLIKELLGAGLSPQEAAERVGCSARTIRRRLNEPGFAMEVAALRAQRARELGGRLTELGFGALDVLHEAMGPEQPMKIRVDAAKSVLRFERDHSGVADIDARIAEIERTMAEVLHVETEEDADEA
jgi:hypothetical protein